MSKVAREILPLALGGLLIGTLLGMLGAGAYATWIVGGDPANIGITTILAFAPSQLGPLTEPFRTAVLIGGAVAIATTIALPAAAFRPRLTSHGSARWATVPELKRAGLTARLQDLKGPIYGKVGSPRSRSPFITSRDIPHSLIAAPTGSGKGIGVVIPTLLTYPGSVFCLDVKGENFEKTARQRLAMGDKIYRFSPYDNDGRSHRYNPLDDVARAPERRRFTEARRLAASFIVAHAGGMGFLEGARDLFAATAMLVIQRGTPTIAAIYDALAQPGEAYKVLQNLGHEVRAEEAQKIFYKLAGLESRVLSSYLTVLSDGGLGLWADPAVREATGASDFDLHNLRSEPASIFVVVSPNDFVPLAPLIRVMVQQTIAIMQRSEPDRAKGEVFPVLFLLDEFVSLGRMDVLADAITTLRSYGGRVMIVVQTMASLEKLYQKEGAAQFLANCRMQLFLSPADKTTPEYISSAAGDFTRKTRTRTWKGGNFETTYQERTDGARLIRPEEVRMLGEDRIVALVQNIYPITAYRVAYFQDRQLNRIFKSQTGNLPLPPIMPRGILPAGEYLAPVEPRNDSGTADARTTAAPVEPASEAEDPAATHEAKVAAAFWEGQGSRETPDDRRSDGTTPEKTDKATGEGGAAADQPAPASNGVPIEDPKKPEDSAGKNEAEEEASRKISGELAGVAVAQYNIIDNIMLDLAAVRRRNNARIAEAGLDDRSEAQADTVQRRPQRRASNPADMDSVIASVRSANVARQDNTT
ncbi:MAG: type IV secretion system ATPase VirD4 [Gemmatimonadetes bacterium]|nr:type IV secretion system ATPase VirD4 [Gemmatimonadota bacterium]